jgi:hypothetical protein
MAFYAALHYVDAYVTQHVGSSPKDHSVRNRLISTVGSLQTIEISYGNHYSASRLSRYEPMRAFRRGEVQANLNEMRYVMAEIRKML